MHYLKILPFIILSVLQTGCDTNMNLYSHKHIEVISINSLTGDSSEIIVQPRLETLYFFPGAKLWDESARLKVGLVRCMVGNQCTVDIHAEDIGQGKYKLQVSRHLKEIDFVFNDTEVAASDMAK